MVTIFLNNLTTVTDLLGHLIAYSEHTEANGRTIDTEEKVITNINGTIIWEVVQYYTAHTRYLIGLSN